jgi:hypothetical protein
MGGCAASHNALIECVPARKVTPARTPKRRITDAAAANRVVGRPQHPGLSSIAYCCKIITPGDVSALTMQAALVELMTMQLIPLEPLPIRKEPVPVAVVSQL